MLFVGSAVALVTPFKKSGEVDYFMMKKLIEFQIASGTKAIVILGTTGESPTISREEREKIIKFCVCLAKHQIKIIVGTGSNSTKKAINLTLQAKNLGADGALIVTPYYNKCSDDGLFEHYRKIAQTCKFPIIVYNVPSRTGVNIKPEVALRLSKLRFVVGIKEASGNMAQINKLIRILPKRVAVYSGDDGLTLPIMAVGGKGVISVTANCYPTEVALLCDFMLKRDLVNALRQHEFLAEINEALFFDVNPIPVKFYMNELGLFVGEPRLPLMPPSTEIQNKLKKVKEKYEN